MNSFAARQRKLDGLWHYTIQRSDGRIAAVGACQTDCPGHATAEEAYEHERQRLVSTAKEGSMENWHGCDHPGCDQPTKKGYHVGRWYFISLCDEHRNMECLDPLVHVGESVES